MTVLYFLYSTVATYFMKNNTYFVPLIHPRKVQHSMYRITGIIRGRKVSRIAFFAVVHEKTFVIQVISLYKNPGRDRVQENIRECFQIREIHETFLPQMIPVIRYMCYVFSCFRLLSMDTSFTLLNLFLLLHKKMR